MNPRKIGVMVRAEVSQHGQCQKVAVIKSTVGKAAEITLAVQLQRYMMPTINELHKVKNSVGGQTTQRSSCRIITKKIHLQKAVCVHVVLTMTKVVRVVFAKESQSLNILKAPCGLINSRATMLMPMLFH